MARRHTKHKISFEMLNKIFNLEGEVFHVDCDINHGIATIHVHGAEIPEGGYAIEKPLFLHPERVKEIINARVLGGEA